MKNIFILVLLLLLFSEYSVGQVNIRKRFNLNVHIEGIDTAVISIGSFFSKGYEIDKKNIKINKGNCEFNGFISHPFNFRLRLNIHGQEYLSRFFYVDYKSDTQYINISVDSFSTQKIAVNNSVFNSEYLISFLEYTKNIEYNIQNWPVKSEVVVNDIENRSYKDSLQNEFNKLLIHKDSLILLYAMHNPDSYVALWELYTRFSLKGYSIIYEDAFSFLDENLKKSLIGIDFAQKLIEAKQLTIGKKFPSILFLKLDGSEQMINYADYKYTLIDFWYSYCGPCIKEFPDLINIYKSFKNIGFNVVSVSTDRKEDVKNYYNAINKYNLVWDHRWDRNGIISAILIINSFPTNFLVDQKGTIVAKNIRPNQLVHFLTQKLK